MELSGAIHALEAAQGDDPVIVNTDSSYVINGITKWVFGWQKNNWKTKEKGDVMNKDLWQKLVHATQGKNIEWQYVGGHVGIPGNERCDEIATNFAKGIKTDLFDGLAKNYGIDLSKSEAQVELLEKKSSGKERSALKAYSYVCFVNGKVYIDKTWAECEKRVKGTKGAKYKKVYSLEEEKLAREEWLK